MLGRPYGLAKLIARGGHTAPALKHWSKRFERRALRLTASAGISELADPEVTSFDRLVSRADGALYAAKAAGRARPAWWDHGHIRVGTPGPGLVRAAG